ncbi:MAG: electron transport complex protein RnfC [bacterium]|nr:electron transport complex protein RnfC [bacterium]
MSTATSSSSAELMDLLRRNGVVGAGGAGFPAYAKLKTPVRTFLLNGAECEPLLHKDKELLKHFVDDVIRGVAMVRDALQAEEAVLGVKNKYHNVIELLESRLEEGMRVHPLPDVYPAGDEFVLVYEATGRVIPPGGLPLHVGAVVMNVETVINIARGAPVTSKYLTVAGAVHEPQTVEVPIGVSIRSVIEACGGAKVEPFTVLTGGAMMGKLPASLDDPITKTTGGLLVFPVDHPLIHKYQRSAASIRLIGKSACDQCSFCTELCPRYLLGHPIEPHKAMRALGFSHEKLSLVAGATFCCECNICSLIACPEDLDPKNVCVMNKAELRAQNFKYPDGPPQRDVHGMRVGRQTPVKRLIVKLGLSSYVNKGPLTEVKPRVESVTLPMRQHVGAPAKPRVKPGDRVTVGQTIGSVDPDQLGCDVHASVNGVVREVDENRVVIAVETD